VVEILVGAGAGAILGSALAPFSVTAAGDAPGGILGATGTF
jgi:hypothetical protein